MTMPPSPGQTSNPDDEAFKALTNCMEAEINGNATPIHVVFNGAASLFTIIGAIELAMKHPHVSPVVRSLLQNSVNDLKQGLHGPLRDAVEFSLITEF